MRSVIKYFGLLLLLLVILFSSPVRNKLTNILEEKPLSKKTLAVLEKNKSTIKHYSDIYDTPAEAVAAAIGSEINRRIYLNKLSDFLQDRFFESHLLCSDRFLDKSYNMSINNRYINFTKQDIGLGNIKFESAWKMREKYPEELKNIKSKRQMVDYLLNESGNIHMATLIIREAKLLFKEHYTELDRIDKWAVLVSYYRQGNSYYDRYKQSGMFKRPPIPGEGKGVVLMLESTIYKN